MTDATPQPVATEATEVVEWVMPTSWPTSLPVLWGNCELFAERVGELTGGGFRITPQPAGAVADPIGLLDVVEAGDFSVGSSATYYYIGRSPVLAFGSALPFGLSARQHSAWLYYGGGLEILNDYYARNFNMIQFPAGNTGAQMGGWFTREVSSLQDLEGLRMRIPGLGGSVMARLGVDVINLGAGEILQALSTGEIDAAEFVGPFDDANLGLQGGAPFYYYPGFWEPGASLDMMVNLDAWNALPVGYQHAFRAAAFESQIRVTAEYDANNGQALNDLLANGTELRQFPDDLLQAARAASAIVLDEIAAGDPEFAIILEEWRNFRRQVSRWFSLAQFSADSL
ncbi:MAG: ABC transporter substrate-binding protein [Actinomycetota bacterium]